jgi:squalene monooxygenase
VSVAPTCAPRSVDVVVAGAGMAGAAAAVVFSELGLETLVVEPGLDNAKRLAGELIHPPGATDLAALGLLNSLEKSGAAAIKGFCVFAGYDEGETGVYELPYAPVPGMRDRGLGLDHSVLAGVLHRELEKLPHVAVWRGARVTALDTRRPDAVTVEISADGGAARVSTRLIVGADGGSSAIRRLTGIAAQRWRISTMLGYVLRGVELPRPEFGNVFLDGSAPVLAYPIGADTVRVMFDIPDDPEGTAAIRAAARSLAGMPGVFAEHVRHAMASQQPLVSHSYQVVPERVVAGRVVLLGDAAGCCHPLTATGLSVCTRDAWRLRDAVHEMAGDIPAALRRYAVRREEPQRTRLALAEALYEIFLARTPEMRLLRRGVLRYWKSSPRACAASMALLSTQEGRMSVMAREYARVVGYALPGLFALNGEGYLSSLGARSRAAVALSRRTLRYAGAAWRALRT